MRSKAKSLPVAVAENLTRHKKTVSVAESCTGGLISHRLTNVPGSSKYFRMSIVAYSNQSKVRQLKIPKTLINKYGPVSKEVTVSMAENVRKLAQTDLGVGVTGIAGPTGSSKCKPIGLIFIALSSKTKTTCKKFHFFGNRQEIKLKASQSALQILLKDV